jgi:hypothetical protein
MAHAAAALVDTTARAQVLHVRALVLEPALLQRFQRGIVPVRPLELTARCAHVERREVAAREMVREIPRREAEPGGERLHRRDRR